MSAAPVILIEVVFVFGAALLWGLHELYQLRRDKRRDEQRRREESAAANDEPPQKD